MGYHFSQSQWTTKLLRLTFILDFTIPRSGYHGGLKHFNTISKDQIIQKYRSQRRAYLQSVLV